MLQQHTANQWTRQHHQTHRAQTQYDIAIGR